MNKFNAMSKVLSAKTMKRNPNNREWSFVFKGVVFAEINKNDGKYFVHYLGRNTALVGHTSFMKAVAVVAGVYLELVNCEQVAGGETVYNHEGVMAFAGADYELYIKTGDSIPVHVPSSMTTFEYLSKYCPHLGGTDKLQDLADLINMNFNDYMQSLT